jgi:hypothetical protein
MRSNLDAVLALDPVLNTGANKRLKQVIHNSKHMLKMLYQLVYAVFQETCFLRNLATLEVSLELKQDQVQPKKLMIKEKN